MRPDSLRRTLYLGTRDLQDALDAHVGQFEGREDYCRYLLGTFEFRAALEPALTAGEFPALRLLPDLQCDLKDLDLDTPADLPHLSLDTEAAWIAALYVSEGSALGARVIVRKAEELGFTDRFGARHLGRQTSERDRWPRFLGWLERQEVGHDLVTTEARRIFALVLQAYRVDA